MDRPKIFIGSSTKGLDVAYAVQQNLERFAEITIWEQGVFELSQTIIANLIRSLDKFDFAVFVFWPEDPINQRGVDAKAVRDNVIFEAGLFGGRLGFDKIFFLKPRDERDLQLPTDLLGVVPGEYDARRSDNNLRAATGPFCSQVRQAIEALRNNRPAEAKSSDLSGPVVVDGIKVYRDINTAYSDLRVRIESDHLTALRAEFIQHSSERAFGLISALADDGARLHLYLQHPATLNVLCSEVRSRVELRLRRYPDELKDMTYDGPLEIYLYRSPATLNGVRIMLDDNTTLLVLSWYTYLSAGIPAELISYRINGSENPCIEIASTHPQYTHFERYFNQMLTNYKNQSTPPLYALPRDKDISLREWNKRVREILQEVNT